jgi:hypothetical protein
VAAAQVQDVVGGDGVAQAVAYVLNAVGGGWRVVSVGVGQLVKVAERRQRDGSRWHRAFLFVVGGAPGRLDSGSTAAPGLALGGGVRVGLR